MRKAEEIYNEIDKVKAETLQIISERGLYSAEEYQAMLLRQYAKEKALKSELTTIIFLYGDTKKDSLCATNSAIRSGHHSNGGRVRSSKSLLHVSH